MRLGRVGVSSAVSGPGRGPSPSSGTRSPPSSSRCCGSGPAARTCGSSLQRARTAWAWSRARSSARRRMIVASPGRQQVQSRLLSLRRLSLVVFVTHERSAEFLTGQGMPGPEARATAQTRVLDSLRRLREAGIATLVVKHPPGPYPSRVPECIALSSAAYDPCTQPREAMTRMDLLAVTASRHPRVTRFVSLDRYFCDELSVPHRDRRRGRLLRRPSSDRDLRPDPGPASRSRPRRAADGSQTAAVSARLVTTRPACASLRRIGTVARPPSSAMPVRPSHAAPLPRSSSQA